MTKHSRAQERAHVSPLASGDRRQGRHRFRADMEADILGLAGSPLGSAGSHRQSFKNLNIMHLGRQEQRASMRNLRAMKITEEHTSSAKNLHKQSFHNLHHASSFKKLVPLHDSSTRSLGSEVRDPKSRGGVLFIESFSSMKIHSAIEHTVMAQNIARLQSLVRSNSLKAIVKDAGMCFAVLRLVGLLINTDKVGPISRREGAGFRRDEQVRRAGRSSHQEFRERCSRLASKTQRSIAPAVLQRAPLCGASHRW